MTQFGSPLHEDSNHVKTSSEFVSANSTWRLWTRRHDGDDATLGAKADTAVTAFDTTPGSVVAVLKGLSSRLATVNTNLGTVITNLGTLITQTSKTALGLMKAEDEGHTTGDYGVMALAVRRDTAAASSGTTGDYEPLQTDDTGRLRTVTRADSRIGALSNARTASLAQTLLVKASAGTLFGLQGYVAADGFVQVHADADGTLSGGAQALEVIRVEHPSGGGGGGPFSLDFGFYGLAVATGITVAFSSVGPTFTGGGSQMFVSAQYE